MGALKVWDGSAWQTATGQGTNGTNGQGVPVGGTIGQVLTKKSVTDFDTQWASPSGEIVYTQITAPVQILNSAASSSHQVVPPTAIAYDGTPIMIEFYSPSVLTPNITGGHIMFNVFDGVTDLGYLGDILCTQPVVQAAVSLRRRFVPTAGVHSYQITAWTPTPVANGGYVYAGTGGVALWPPAFMRITRA